MADITHITIDHAPNKTTYRVGDRFERYGMVVKAHYDDGTSSTIDFYSYSPSGALLASNTEITVTAFGKTAVQFVTVLAVPERGYFPDKLLASADYGPNPYVNAADGSFVFYCSPITLGVGSYEMNVTLSYRSRTTDRESALIKGLPKGWRTSFHAFLVQDGYDNNLNPTYKYIDGSGLIHTFVYGDGMTFLYDKEGQGLLLDPVVRTITCLNGDLFSFDASGRLVSVVSGLDSDSEKIIEYNSEGIRKVYDAREPGTFIKFSYQNSYIRYIRLYQGDNDNPIKTYMLGGMPGQLLSLEEMVGTSTRTLYQFAVNDRDLLRRVVDCPSKEALRITYAFDQALNAYRVDSVRKGYLNGDAFVQHKGVYCASREVDSSCEYGLMREFVLTNDDEIDISLFTDSEGELVSIFEKGHDDEINYYSLIRDEGIWLANEGTAGERISNSTAKDFYGSLQISDIDISPSSLSGSKTIKLIGYVKIKGRPDRARLSASSQHFSCGSVDLNHKAYYAWQYFELPLQRNVSNGQPESFDSFAVSLMDGSGRPILAEAANLQLAKDTHRTKLFFLNHGSPVVFDDLTTVKLYSSSSEYISVSMGSASYMTESDLLLTIKEYYRSSDGVHVAYFLKGRKLMGFGPTIVGETLGGVTVPFLNPQFVSNETIGTSSNWFFAESETGGARKYYRFYQNYYEIVIRTEVGQNPTSYEFETSRYDYHDRLILKTGKDGTKTKYEYFPDGMLKKSGILTQNGETYACVLYEASLNQSGKEITRLTREGVSRDFQYYSDGLPWKSLVNSVQGGQITNTSFYRELSYDDFRNDVAGEMFKNGEMIQEEHSYNRPSQSYKTNHIGDIASRYKVSYEVSTKTTTLAINDGTDYANVLTAEESAHGITTEYDNCQTHGGGFQEVSEGFDEYGFPISISYGGVQMATFTYAENFASRYCSLLARVIDLFSGRNVLYSYNEDNEISSVHVGDFTVSYSMDDSGTLTTQYDYGLDSYSTLSGASFAYALDSVSEITSSLWSYQRDNLGRVLSKSDTLFSNALNQSYSYLNDYPSRVCAYSFGDSVGTSYSESYTYGDGFGNITGVNVSSSLFSYSSSCQFDGFGRIVSETNTKLGISRAYQYQAMGSSPSGPVGRMASFGDSQMEYDEKGRLVRFGGNFYSYDHYGNRASRNQVSYQWERGTLLSYCGASRFEYDYKGLRSLKADPSGLSHEYFYDGERLVGEDIRNGSSTIRKLRFFYDLDGLCALRVIEGNATSDYVYIRNPLGDIVGIAEGSAIKALYVYDAWGNHVVYDESCEENTSSSFIGNVNPFRYRGYYYDSDTGLYYLRSRYYDPEIGQFISPDGVGYMDFEAIGGLNLYAYCGYNPVMYSDPSGHAFASVLIALGIGALLGLLGGTANALIADYNDNGLIDGTIGFRRYFGNIVGGTIVGAALGFANGAGAAWLAPYLAGTGSGLAALGGLGASLGVSFIGGFFGYSTNKWISGDEWDFGKALSRGALTAIEGLFAYGAGGVVGLVKWDGGKIIHIGNKEINITEKIVQSYVSDTFSNPIAWIIDKIMEYLYG